jgi:predicted ATPase
VLHEQRKALHEKTAEAVEVLRSDNLEDHYGELAYHYSKGGNVGKAIEYLNLAGQQAAQRSSYPEAIGHLTRALELLNTLEDTPERAQQELVIQMALGTAQMVTKGYAAREVGLAYAKADELCRQVGDRPERIDVLLGLWMFHLGKSEATTAREMAEQVLRVAQEQNDPTAVLKAHIAMSHSLFFQGELVAAHRHLDLCMGIYDADPRHESTVSIGGVDCQVRAHCYAAWSLWLLGHPEQALASGTAAQALTQDLAHPFASMWVSVIVASIHGWRGELPAVREYAETIVAQSQEQGSVMCRAEGTILRSLATAEPGRDENHVREAAEAVAILRDSAMQGWLPYYLALLAEIQCKAGHADDGLRVSGDAIEFCERLGEKWYEAELYRLKGEMTLQSGGEHPAVAVQREAEACFEKALEIAKKQSARSWELRASTSLSRLWRQQGKRTEARQLLAGIYNWFTEGFDTKDLQEAKALLEELV